jgi:phospholipid:diacylglycerol acyltransferase
MFLFLFFPGLNQKKLLWSFVSRAIAPGVLESDIFGFQTLQYIMKVTRTWDACLSMLPKGGKTIWGDVSWSPEEGYDCAAKKSDGIKDKTVVDENEDGVQLGRHGKPFAHYGRMVAFGKDIASLSHEAILERKKEITVNSLTALNSPISVGGKPSVKEILLEDQEKTNTSEYSEIETIRGNVQKG